MKPKQTQKNVIEDIEQNNKLMRLSTASVIVLVVVAFMLSVYGLYKINAIEIPAFIKDIFNPPDDSEYTEKDYDDKKFLEFIESKNDDNKNNIIHIDIAEQDNVLSQLIAEAPFVNEYSMTQYVYHYSADRRQVIYKNNIWVKGEKYLVERYDESDTLTKRILCDGDKIYVEDNIVYDDVHVKTYPISDMFTLENQVGLIEIKKLFTDETIIDITIELDRTKNNNSYKVNYSYSDISGLREEVKVIFEYGLIYESDTYYNDELISKMHTESKINVGNISDDKFNLYSN